MEGYIKLHRKILEWEWYDDPNTMRLFIHVLLKANYTDKTWRGIMIKRGQLLTSLSTLSEETQLSVKQVRASIDRLKRTNEMASYTTSQYTILEVVNYDSYQSERTNNETNEGQAEGKARANEGQQHKNTKKDKKEKKTETIEKTEVFSCVRLSIEQIQNLEQVYGKHYQKAIEKLSAYKISKGKEYKSDYHTLIPAGWVYKTLKEEIPDLGKIQVELDTKKQKEDKEKEEKKRVDKEKRDADIRNAELEKFYKSLSDEEKKSITDLAEKSLSHISQKARDDFPDNYRLFLQNKRRQITEVYKNTGKLPDLQTK